MPLGLPQNMFSSLEVSKCVEFKIHKTFFLLFYTDMKLGF